MADSVDILMVVHNRADYLSRTFPIVVGLVRDGARLWVWRNGEDTEVGNVIDRYRREGGIYRYCHSPSNIGLREPLNWLIANSDAALVGKIDDDLIIPGYWLKAMKEIHRAAKGLAVVGGWSCPTSDLSVSATKRLRVIDGKRILLHSWVAGGNFVAKAARLRRVGTLGPEETFPDYCLRVAWDGGKNAWWFPDDEIVHLDDPRFCVSGMTSEENFCTRPPLTAVRAGARSLSEWIDVLKRAARAAQNGSWRPGKCFYLRMVARRMLKAVRVLAGR